MDDTVVNQATSEAAEPEATPQDEAPAHEALRAWFEADKSRTYTGMARVLDLAAATVGRWCHTVAPTRPTSVAHLFAIQIVTGIPPHAWLTPTEAAFLSKLSNGAFVTLFERQKRHQAPDPRQMHFDAFWRPEAPQAPSSAGPEGDFDLERDLGELD